LKLKSDKLYTNEQWLRNQYLKLKKSTCKISREQKCSTVAIQYWLRRFRIPTRSHSVAGSNALTNHINLSSEAIEFLNGSLLGDGHLNHQSKWASAYSQGSKFQEFLVWTAQKLANYGIEQVGRIYKSITRLPKYNKKYTVYSYCSKSYAELMKLRRKWYSKGDSSKKPEFQKVIPFFLKLTPLTCLMWYLGDGSVNSRSVTLSTVNFTVYEIDFLRGKLDRLGFETTRLKGKTIHILTKSTKGFLDYIGDCPVECYKYRWKIRRYSTR